MADDPNTLRETAIYARTVAWLRHTSPHLSDEEIDAQGLAAVPVAVFGHDARKNSKGEYQQQGIGSKGRESLNHLAAVKKWEGVEAYNREVARIWKETPEHAKKLGLQPVRT